MKLSELDPHWFCLVDERVIVGFTFKCPHCQIERLGVMFHRKGYERLDDTYIKELWPNPKFIWTMEGTDFHNLTITPSIDASASGHWHGFIVDGEIK